MSYNIDKWKTKKINNLRIPIQSFFTNSRKDWHPNKEYDENGLLTLTMFESEIKGKVIDGILEISSINIEGEGSGTSIDWIIEPALKDSTGELIASCIWEGGDSINKLIVKDGVVKWEDIEL